MKRSLSALVVFVVLPSGCKDRSGEESLGASKGAPSVAPAKEAGAAKAPAGTVAKADVAAKPGPGAGAAPPSGAVPGAMVRTPSGLEYEVLKQGDGPSPPLGSRIMVHFAGFVDGKKFMDTRDGGVPREFKLDKARLIDGWVEALLTMKKGEKRKLNVPSRLAYGKNGYPGLVPPGKDVAFDLELVSFLPPSGGS